MAGAAKGSAACSDMFSKLNLTDSQKAQVEALKESAKRATSTSEAHAMFQEGLAKILTPDQMTQFKAQCDKAKAGGECPYMKSQKKS
jgi:Spy/CpxP family protein refolding chaperone